MPIPVRFFYYYYFPLRLTFPSTFKEHFLYPRPKSYKFIWLLLYSPNADIKYQETGTYTTNTDNTVLLGDCPGKQPLAKPNPNFPNMKDSA